ncbi:MAG: TonB-dependent receptor [Bacteroidales bacterium]
MHKVIRIGTLTFTCCIIAGTLKISAHTDTIFISKVIELEEVEITGQKSPAELTDVPRLVTVFTKKESESAPSQSIHDLLRYSSTIDSRQRGKGGIQTDLSIRGSSFDQVLVLFNGIPVSDPQTGHLSMILPVEKEAIKKIDILTGPAARVHGTNAFAGVVNFVTGPAATNSLDLSLSGGSYGYISTSATANISAGKVRQLVHYHYGRSAGYAYNTDYKKHNVFYQGQIEHNSNTLDLQFGIANRAFGANGFYTPALPEQYEENQMTFASIGYSTHGVLRTGSKIYWRRHRDRFEYFREGKDWYRFEDGICISNEPEKTSRDTIFNYSQHNHHINDAFGASLFMSIKTKTGVTTIDWHLRSEHIISNNIGHERVSPIPVRNFPGVFYTKSDSRQNLDLNIEQTFSYRKLFIAGGVLLNWNSYLPDELNLFPGLDLRFDILKQLKIIGSYNYTNGLPTFTDLTYEDQDNEGNLDLLPYSKNSVESGLRFVSAGNISNMVFFYEYGKNVIDWVWFSDISKFRPVNTEAYTGRGFELTTVQDFSFVDSKYWPVQKVSVFYTFIDMKKEIPGNVAKYFNVRHKLSFMISHKIINRLTAAWNISYTDREGSYLNYDFENSMYVPKSFVPYWLVDIRLSYYLKQFTFFLEATNLFDKKYVDTGSIYQPGRWLSAGIKYKFTHSH